MIQSYLSGIPYIWEAYRMPLYRIITWEDGRKKLAKRTQNITFFGHYFSYRCYIKFSVEIFLKKQPKNVQSKLRKQLSVIAGEGMIV